MPQAHPNASKRAEELALRALDGLASEPSASAPDSPYSASIPISAELSDKDILGPIIGSRSDRFGREVERWYATPASFFILRGAAHNDFRAAVRTVHQQPEFRRQVSEEAIARLTFEWICHTRIEGAKDALITFLNLKLQALIAEVEVVIPIFGVHVQSPLKVGQVTIADVSAAELDRWEQMSSKHLEPTDPTVDLIHAGLRKKVQGRAAARLTIAAEEGFAVQYATEQAELAVAILRLASIGAFAPEKPVSAALMGTEHVPREIHLLVRPPDHFSSAEAILNPEDYRPWILDDGHVERVIRPLIAPWSALLAKERRTAFEEAALRSVLLYSRSTRYRNISEKLLHVFAGIEGLLLRSESEPIAATVGDRLAFAVGRTADERIKIVRQFRAVYSIRSRFVHHALEPAPESSTLELLEGFLVTASQFFMNVGHAASRFAAKEDFIDSLEKRKYA